MTLSPLALPFFSCTSSLSLSFRKNFLSKSSYSLSSFDFHLLYEVLNEWESCVTLAQCFSLWEKYIPIINKQDIASLNTLSFNVRGLKNRWQEVALLISSFKPDIVFLLETGNIKISSYESKFPDFKLYYQKGENKQGGVLVLVHHTVNSSRFPCSIPNVCCIDVQGVESIRICGVYTPDSKTAILI